MSISNQPHTFTHIRWMIRRDMPEVLNIEGTGNLHPWSEETFIRHLRQRNCIGKIAERDERVIGFMVFECHRSRYHLLNFAVHPDFWREGVGSRMIGELMKSLSPQRRVAILANVRESNLAAQLFFRSRGFRAVSVLRDFFDGSDPFGDCEGDCEFDSEPEDAYLMEYRLPIADGW